MCMSSCLVCHMGFQVELERLGAPVPDEEEEDEKGNLALYKAKMKR